MIDELAAAEVAADLLNKQAARCEKTLRRIREQRPLANRRVAAAKEAIINQLRG